MSVVIAALGMTSYFQASWGTSTGTPCERIWLSEPTTGASPDQCLTHSCTTDIPVRRRTHAARMTDDGQECPSYVKATVSGHAIAVELNPQPERHKDGLRAVRFVTLKSVEQLSQLLRQRNDWDNRSTMFATSRRDTRA